MKLITIGGGTMVGLVLTMTLALAVAVAGSHPPVGPATPTAEAEIPASLLPVYIDAASTCPGLPWQVLAAIGQIESGHDARRLDPATGAVQPAIIGPALDGTNGTARISDPTTADGWTHALGPMQFLPTTWDRWGRLAPGRPPGAQPDVHNAWDAIYSAAAYLCGTDRRLDDLDTAILTYNRSRTYLDAVMAKAADYGHGHGDRRGADGRYCPVAGAVAFTDDWGAPRSGGRTHRGNDLFARHGTPLIAIEAGTITRATNTDQGLGGISLWLTGDSGATYYYAHNTSNAVAVGDRVEAGQLIAYLGNTGNAATTPPHVHFQLHPDGGQAVNPYRTLSAVCN